MAIDIEANSIIGSDFGDLEMRVLAQYHDETVVEMKTGQNLDPRTILKQLQAYASLAGMPPADQLLSARVNYGGTQRSGTPFGIADAFKRMPRFSWMAQEDRCWAMAFQDVLGVSDLFYVKADFARKRWLEQHYTELASHDTSKGRKAAKVVAKRVMYSLEEREPATLKHQGTATFSTKHTLQQSPQSISKLRGAFQLTGKTPHSVIIDDAIEP